MYQSRAHIGIWRTIARAPASLSDSMFTTPANGLSACTDTIGVRRGNHAEPSSCNSGASRIRPSVR